MTPTLLIIDDDINHLKSITELAQCIGLTPIGFYKPSQALTYLKSITEPPAGCLVDMKPYNYIPKDFCLEDYPESPVPEQIFMFLKEKGWVKNFYFMTGDVSDYDRGVLDRTGAEYFEKGQSLVPLLEKILKDCI